MIPLLIGIALVAFLAGVTLDRLALRFLRPPRRAVSRSPGDMGLEAEDVVVPGEVPLRLWMMEPAQDESVGEGRDPRPSVVLLTHGWGADSSEILQLAPTLIAEGHHVAALDVRGHGRSEEGPFVTLRHFRDDIARTTRLLRERYPGARISLVGHSMGGAASLLVVADGAEIEHLVMVAAPYDVYDATHRFLRRKRLPADAMVGAFRLFWKRRVGVPFDEVHPGLRAPELRIPTLVVQPEHDRQVPADDGRRLAEAAGARFELIVNAGHSDVLALPTVHRMIVDFLRD